MYQETNFRKWVIKKSNLCIEKSQIVHRNKSKSILVPTQMFIYDFYVNINMKSYDTIAWNYNTYWPMTTHSISHGDKIWFVFEEEFDYIRVIVFCCQVKWRLPILQTSPQELQTSSTHKEEICHITIIQQAKQCTEWGFPSFHLYLVTHMLSINHHKSSLTSSVALASAFILRRVLHTSICPVSAARWRAVFFARDRASTDAPWFSTRSFTKLLNLFDRRII